MGTQNDKGLGGGMWQTLCKELKKWDKFNLLSLPNVPNYKETPSHKKVFVQDQVNID